MPLIVVSTASVAGSVQSILARLEADEREVTFGIACGSGCRAAFQRVGEKQHAIQRFARD